MKCMFLKGFRVILSEFVEADEFSGVALVAKDQIILFQHAMAGI